MSSPFKTPTKRKKQPTSTADEARSITKSLRRTQALLSQELERVSHVSEAIDEDGKLLQKTKTQQHIMNDTAKDANAALRNLQLQQRKETLVLMTAVFFFMRWHSMYYGLNSHSISALVGPTWLHKPSVTIPLFGVCLITQNHCGDNVSQPLRG
ncbi:hypothetical protein MHU86_11470 [Fragilaria crotonensis]|nr:hypothetical protein MHU86_11470 [Fragilaria crotonensis]